MACHESARAVPRPWRGGSGILHNSETVNISLPPIDLVLPTSLLGPGNVDPSLKWAVFSNKLDEPRYPLRIRYGKELPGAWRASSEAKMTLPVTLLLGPRRGPNAPPASKHGT